MQTAPPLEGRTNILLDALSAAQAELATGATPLELQSRAVLFEPGQAVDAVYFPLTCIVSLVTPLEPDANIEVATIGRDGMVGVPLVRGGSLAVRAVCQVGGWALRLDAATFLAAQANDRVRDLVGKYLLALFGQISQAAACNRLHSNRQRLSRWLLMCNDGVGADEFTITHEFLGEMLGSRRATVSLTAGSLQAAGLIRYHRGRITILNRAGLEAVTCECYATTSERMADVLGRAELRGRRLPGEARGMPMPAVRPGAMRSRAGVQREGPAAG